MLTRFLIDESAQAMVEYGLILGFVAVVATSLLLGIQIPLKSFFDGVEAELIKFNV